MIVLKRLSRMWSIPLLVLVLSACSTGSETQSTTVPSEPAPPSTITPGGTSVGAVLDDVNVALASMHSIETTFWTTTGADIGDTPPTTGEVTIEMAIVPNQRHVIRLVDGVVVEEQIAKDGRIYMKGPIVVAAIAPMVGTETWVEVDPRGAGTASAVAAQLTWLLSPVASPFQQVSQDTRALEAFPGEPIQVTGRTCHAWRFGEADGIQQEIAVDDQGLPCRLIQRAGDHANVTIYRVDVPEVSIEAPTVATPFAP